MSQKSENTSVGPGLFQWYVA